MEKEFKREIAERIGRRLRAARKWRRLRLSDLARRSSIENRLLQRYEAGDDAITIDELERIATALRLPIGHFLDGCVLCGSE